VAIERVIAVETGDAFVAETGGTDRHVAHKAHVIVDPDKIGVGLRSCGI